MRQIFSIISGMVLCMFIFACSHKEIICPSLEPHSLSLAFMWDNAPKASPDGMTVYFYPLGNGGKVWRFDIAGRDGGEIELPAGRYCMVAVNNDLPGVVFTGQDAYTTFAATPKYYGSTASPTGMLYRAVVGEIEQTMCGVRYRSPDGAIKECPYGLVRCYPDSAAVIYNIIVEKVDGLDRIRKAYARLSGMASNLYLATDKPGSEMCATETALKPTAQGGLCSVSSGLGSTAVPDFTLTLVVERNDGNRFAKSFDVTAQVINSPAPRNVTIHIDSLSVPSGPVPPPPDDEDVGISVDIDGWNVIEINYDENININ